MRIHALKALPCLAVLLWTMAGTAPADQATCRLRPVDGPQQLLQFDLTALAGKPIVSARLLYARDRAAPPSPDALVDIEILPLAAPFAGDKPVADAQALKLVAPWFHSFDATGIVRQWVEGKRANHGLYVKTFPAFEPKAACLDVTYEGAPGPLPQQAAGLRVLCRDGQTFITWKEIDDPVGKDEVLWRELMPILERLDATREVRYRVYRSRSPITAKGIGQAECIAVVRPLSCWNVNGRNVERPIDLYIATSDTMFYGHGNPFGRAEVDGPFGLDCPIDRFVISDGGKPLPRGTGLYVHTAAEAGSFHYAVVTQVDGAANLSQFSAANATAEPVAETVAEPAPVLQGELPAGPMWSYPDRRLHYVRWVGPPYGNLPSQYFNWSVAIPTAAAEDPRPVELSLHRDGFSYWRTQYRIEQDSIVLCPHDFPLKSWWFGYPESAATLRSVRDGAIHNYTERRLLSFLKWAMAKWSADPERVLITGCRGRASGTGALQLGLRNPDVFSLVVSGHGVADLGRTIRDTKGDRRERDFAPAQEPFGLLDWDLKTDTGKSVWEELNANARLAALPPKAELPMVALACNFYIHWGLWPQWDQFLRQMLDQKRPILASFQWYGPVIVPVSHTGTYPDVIRLRIARDRPALAFRGPGAKVMEKQGGDMGLFNLGFRWRDDVVDAADRFEATVFWAARGEAKGPVTLRRLQRFRVEPGRTYAWSARPLAEAEVPQSGEAAVGADGLLTIPELTVTNAGCRLTVTAK